MSRSPFVFATAESGSAGVPDCTDHWLCQHVHDPTVVR
jgi:hypothetical protein